jgi:hypothetical protein
MYMYMYICMYIYIYIYIYIYKYICVCVRVCVCVCACVCVRDHRHACGCTRVAVAPNPEGGCRRDPPATAGWSRPSRNRNRRTTAVHRSSRNRNRRRPGLPAVARRGCRAEAALAACPPPPTAAVPWGTARTRERGRPIPQHSIMHLRTAAIDSSPSTQATGVLAAHAGAPASSAARASVCVLAAHTQCRRTSGCKQTRGLAAHQRTLKATRTECSQRPRLLEQCAARLGLLLRQSQLLPQLRGRCRQLTLLWEARAHTHAPTRPHARPHGTHTCVPYTRSRQKKIDRGQEGGALESSGSARSPGSPPPTAAAPWRRRGGPALLASGWRPAAGQCRREGGAGTAQHSTRGTAATHDRRRHRVRGEQLLLRRRQLLCKACGSCVCAEGACTRAPCACSGSHTQTRRGVHSRTCSAA